MRRRGMNGGIMLYNAAGSLESEGLPEMCGELYVSRHSVATRPTFLWSFWTRQRMTNLA